MKPMYVYGLFREDDALIGIVLTEKGAKGRIRYKVEDKNVVDYYKPIYIKGNIGRCAYDNREEFKKIPGGELLLHSEFERECSCCKGEDAYDCCGKCGRFTRIDYYIYPITIAEGVQ